MQRRNWLEGLTKDKLAATTFGEVEKIENELQQFKSKLPPELVSSIERKIVRVLSELAERNLHDENFKLQLQDLNSCRTKFVKILQSPAQPPDPTAVERFDEFASWGADDPRVNAVEGFTAVLHSQKGAADIEKQLLRNLTSDPSPAVKLALGVRIWRFLDYWPDFVWETLEKWINELPTLPGVQGVVQHTMQNQWFWWLYNRDATRASQLLKLLWKAARANNSSDMCEHCGGWIAAAAIIKSENWALVELRGSFSNIEEYSSEWQGALKLVTDRVFPRDTLARNKTEVDLAIQFAKSFLDAAINKLARLIGQGLSQEEKNANKPKATALARLIGTFGTEFQFSAENHSNEWKTLAPNQGRQKAHEWLDRAEPILERLEKFPHPGVIYRLIEGLNFLFRWEPVRVLSWLRRLTVAGVKQGLAAESLAADDTLRMLEVYLVDFRTELTSGSPALDDFTTVLECYLEAGWPKAVALAVKIEEIYR